MSNDLNSVLIEGKLPEDAMPSGKGKQDCTFFIHSSRLYKEGDELKEELTSVGVVTTGELADRCRSLKTGRIVRVVGRLSADEACLYIQADHVEFRPH
jgi:single-stranded DNA-binding protein